MLPIDVLARKDMTAAAKGLLCSLCAMEAAGEIVESDAIVDLCGGRKEASEAYKELVRLGYASRDEVSGDVVVDPWGGHAAVSAPRARRRKADDFPEDFLRFWSVYPRKDGKLPAARAWRLLAPNGDLEARIVADVKRRASSPEWTKESGAYIPHASTYLNQRRWEDEQASQTAAPTRSLFNHPGHPSQRLYLSDMPEEDRARIIEEYERLASA